MSAIGASVRYVDATPMSSIRDGAIDGARLLIWPIVSSRSPVGISCGMVARWCSGTQSIPTRRPSGDSVPACLPNMRRAVGPLAARRDGTLTISCRSWRVVANAAWIIIARYVIPAIRMRRPSWPADGPTREAKGAAKMTPQKHPKSKEIGSNLKK